MPDPMNNEQLNAEERLDHAMMVLEQLNDDMDRLLEDLEQANIAYDLEFLRQVASSREGPMKAKLNAELHCLELGLDQARRSAKVKVDANRARATNVRAILDGLRTINANERSVY